MSKDPRPEITFDITVDAYVEGEHVDSHVFENKAGACIATFGNPYTEDGVGQGVLFGNLNLEDTARLILETFRDAEENGSGILPLLRAVMSMIQEDIANRTKDVELIDKTIKKISDIQEQFPDDDKWHEKLNLADLEED